MTKKHSDDDGHKKNTSTEDSKPLQDPSRRKFVKNTGMIAGGVVGGSLLGGLLTNEFKSKSNENPSNQEHNERFQEARQFFSRYEDFLVLAAATERIFPKDDNGPGAIELGVPYFIDKQLAGRWGINGRDYRHAPFMQQSSKKVDNSNAQVEQLILNRGEIFIQGLRKMNQLSENRFKTTFDKADEDQQIEILKDFDDGKVKMNGVPSKSFFILLRQSTLEGAYADPLYGGNKNMEGWKMKNFPGAQASYANVVEEDDFVKMEPMSLNDYQQH
ncbi:gluconate 2-dehydrogenase gamma chain [Virgibacillus halotolerans]|uniref:gluconate 2-dehydrogenase subunit 3 family protein n=1 Tax=Virgibacillus halotolerans TaxID=1071053 RepID=UPI0030B82CC0|nr:gluconate 2-dehydrogenase gamma chain [Virgibacillus halotolerans]